MAGNASFKRIGIIGAGSMGSMMSLGLAEKGFQISLWDIASSNVDSALQEAEETGDVRDKITGFEDIGAFAKSFEDERKLLIFSISHGHPADSVLEMMGKESALKKGDIVLDGGNEFYRATERRQRKMQEDGMQWVGMGVSGGYQSARRGPSLSPGGDEATIKEVLPVLQTFAAKYKLKNGEERACVEYIGPGGAGHFVKMVHNGIENGMLGAICEAWSFMYKGLGMGNEEIGKVFESWNAKGELRGTFLIQIGSEICEKRKMRERDGKGEGVGEDGFVLDEVLDKVVQDDDDTEGTGYWSVMEAAEYHVSSPTIAAAQFMRVSSGNRAQRLKVAEKLKAPEPGEIEVSDGEKDKLVEDLRRAVYATTLVSFCQGLELIARASKDEGWNVDLAACIRIWRAGCIIQSDHIADMLEPIFAANSKSSSDLAIMNMKLIDEVADELHQNCAPLKCVIVKAIGSDAYVPTLSSALEYLKYESGKMLPTQFMEAEMDFFGAHGFDRPGVKGEDPGKTKKGKHHYEWRPA